MEGREITVRTYSGNNLSDERPAIEYKDGTIVLKKLCVTGLDEDPETGDIIPILDWCLSDEIIKP